MAPVTVMAKIFIQQLWKENLDLDASIPHHLQKQWNDFSRGLLDLSSIQIPRHVFNGNLYKIFSLHVFSDASTRAYGAAVYFRTILPDNTVTIRLLCDKSKVTPIDERTIPKLELCAAVLGTKLLNKVKIVYFWYDSEIVLWWIHGSEIKLKTFTRNRIVEILKHTIPIQWRHVKTAENPAYFIFRGMHPRYIYGSDCQWNMEF